MFKDTTNLYPFEKRVWLASPTMHGDELKYMEEAYRTNWMSTAGANIDALEETVGVHMGGMHAVALSSGTAALHLAVKLAALKLYGSRTGTGVSCGSCRGGSLSGRRIFCSDMTFAATVNPIVYEGGEPVFLDTEYDTWNMDPKALERAFAVYPDVRLVVMAHLYGTPGKISEIRRLCDAHGALLIEDAAESLGASGRDTEGKLRQTGTFGDYGVISFNGNKIITGSSGGMLLCHTKEEADRARKWSTQSREAAPWYQHEELGYNYRMSNVIAGIVRGQWGYLREHIDRKREIYTKYCDGLSDIPIKMNPYDAENSEPNFWLSCLLIDSDAMCGSVRTEREYLYRGEAGKSCPDEILEMLKRINAEGRPIWKPMHMQPMYRMHPFVTREGDGRAKSNAYIASGTSGKDGLPLDVGMDIFDRGLCLPSDIKMTGEEQERVMEAIRGCFG